MTEATNVIKSEIKNQFYPVFYRRWQIFEATASTNNTITTSGLGTLASAVGIRKDTGAEITCTVAKTVITITSTLTNVPVVVLAVGETGA